MSPTRTYESRLRRSSCPLHGHTSRGFAARHVPYTDIRVAVSPLVMSHRRTYESLRRSSCPLHFGRVFLQLPLQRTPMHLQPPRGLRDVPVAVREDAVQVL